MNRRTVNVTQVAIETTGVPELPSPIVAYETIEIRCDPRSYQWYNASTPQLYSIEWAMLVIECTEKVASFAAVRVSTHDSRKY